MSVIKLVLTRITIDTGLETREWNFTNVLVKLLARCVISVNWFFIKSVTKENGILFKVARWHTFSRYLELLVSLMNSLFRSFVYLCLFISDWFSHQLICLEYVPRKC